MNSLHKHTSTEAEYGEVLSVRGVVHVVNGKNRSMVVDDGIAYFLQSSYCLENARPYAEEVDGTRVFLRVGLGYGIPGSLENSSQNSLFVFSVPVIGLRGCVAISKDVVIENAE